MNKILCILLLVLAQPFARSQEEPHPPGMLGVHLHEVYPEDVDRLQLPGQYGAVVDEVSPGSAAELAGIKPFDVIHTFHGHRVASARALQRMVRETPAGRPVEMGLFRGGEVLTMNVTLQEAPRMEPPMLEDEEPDLSPDDLAEMLRNHPWIVRQAQGRRLGATVQGWCSRSWRPIFIWLPAMDCW